MFGLTRQQIIALFFAFIMVSSMVSMAAVLL